MTQMTRTPWEPHFSDQAEEFAIETLKPIEASDMIMASDVCILLHAGKAANNKVRYQVTFEIDVDDAEIWEKSRKRTRH